MTLASKLRLLAIAGFLLLTGYFGIREGVPAIRSAVSVGQKVAAVTQLLYGLLGVAALLGVVTRDRWTTTLLTLWGLTLVATATLGPVVWGGTGPAPAVAAGATTTLVVGLVLWAWRRHKTAKNETTDEHR
jgi:hypothetical protein